MQPSQLAQPQRFTTRARHSCLLKSQAGLTSCNSTSMLPAGESSPPHSPVEFQQTESVFTATTSQLARLPGQSPLASVQSWLTAKSKSKELLPLPLRKTRCRRFACALIQVFMRARTTSWQQHVKIKSLAFRLQMRPAWLPRFAQTVTSNSSVCTRTSGLRFTLAKVLSNRFDVW